MAARRYRRRYKRRRVVRKRAFKSFAKKVYRAVRYKSEKKQVLRATANAGISIQSSGVLDHVNRVDQGAGKDQRIGNKIRGRFLKFKMILSNNTVAGTVVRVSIVRGRTSNLAIGDAPTNNLVQLWDIDKWQVLYDRNVGLNDMVSYNPDTVGVRNYIWEKSFRVPWEQLFDGSSGISQTTNPVFLFLAANDSVLPSPVAYYSYAFSFTDI
ncbi:capsid protein [Capybara virus 18_cap1_371]|nr:capsid protein [Capybara virus 18_cap1_371]